MSELELVQEENTDAFGLYNPEENTIITYIGNDEHRIHGDYYGLNWHSVEQTKLTESIENDIEFVREDIAELKDRELTEEQERELRRAESRLQSHENVLDIAKAVQE